MTIESLVNSLNNFEEIKQIDLKWLLFELLEIDYKSYLLNRDLEVDSSLVDKFNLYKDKYINEFIPVQQLVGYTYFYGEKFYLNENTLIPRKETEILIEEVLKVLNAKYSDLSKLKILDLGTGTGIIGITLKKLTNAFVEVVDISQKALLVTKENAKYHNVDIKITESNWFSNVNGKYDLIISNPPYIKEDFLLESHVLKDPLNALYSGVLGLDSYNEILKDINNHLNDSFVVAFEHGYDQADSLESLIKDKLNDVQIKKIKDYDNNDRVIIITK